MPIDAAQYELLEDVVYPIIIINWGGAFLKEVKKQSCNGSWIQFRQFCLGELVGDERMLQMRCRAVDDLFDNFRKHRFQMKAPFSHFAGLGRIEWDGYALYSALPVLGDPIFPCFLLLGFLKLL